MIILGIITGLIPIQESFATPPCFEHSDDELLRYDFVIGETTGFEFIDRVSGGDFPHSSWKVHYKTIENFERFQENDFVVHEIQSVYFKANENKFGKQFLLFLLENNDNTYSIPRCMNTLSFEFQKDAVDYYLDLIHKQKDIPKPLEQNKNNVSLLEFQCRYGKIPLLLNDNNNDIICMNITSVGKIYSRGLLHTDNFHVNIITDKEEYDSADSMNILLKNSGVLPMWGELKLSRYGEVLLEKNVFFNKETNQTYNFTWNPISMNEYQNGTYLLQLDMKTFVGDLRIIKEIHRVLLLQ